MTFRYHPDVVFILSIPLFPGKCCRQCAEHGIIRKKEEKTGHFSVWNHSDLLKIVPRESLERGLVRMEFDAFSVGRPGGLLSRSDIKLLICYLLRSVKEPLERQHLAGILQDNSLANYFEVVDISEELVAQGHLSAEKAPDGDVLLHVTERGRETAQELELSLPLTVREKAVKAAVRLLSRLRLEKENRVAIEDTSDGCYVTCHVSDGKQELMSLRLLVADHLQAQTVKEQFLENPARVYQGVLALQTGDYTLFSQLF